MVFIVIYKMKHTRRIAGFKRKTNIFLYYGYESAGLISTLGKG